MTRMCDDLRHRWIGQSIIGGILAGVLADAAGAADPPAATEPSTAQGPAAPPGLPPPSPTEAVVDKWKFNLLNPTPRELMRPMSTDRPDVTESPMSVDAGHLQLEMSFADYTYDRSDGESVHALAVAPFLLKLGLLNNVDLQFGFTPYSRVQTRGDADPAEADALVADVSNTLLLLEGLGDILLRMKVNVWGNDEGPTAFAIMPFVTLPTGSGGLGSDDVEGGVVMPFGADLPLGFSLGLMAQFDFVRYEDRGGYYAEFIHTGTIGHDLFDDVGAFVEYVGIESLGPDRPYQAYFNAGMTWQPGADLMFDAGVRIGLNSASEDIGVFVGMSIRH